jgi:hypothetical protein
LLRCDRTGLDRGEIAESPLEINAKKLTPYGLVPRNPHGVRAHPSYFFCTISASIVIETSSPTTTPPLSIVAFHFTP